MSHLFPGLGFKDVKVSATGIADQNNHSKLQAKGGAKAAAKSGPKVGSLPEQPFGSLYTILV